MNLFKSKNNNKIFRRITSDLSDVGVTRDKNEDFAWSGSSDILDNLLIVADGLGSYAGSDLASKITSKVFIKSFLNKEYLKTDINKWFEKNILRAKLLISEQIKSNLFYKNMSTTLVLSLVIANQAHVFWIGDSRAYLLSSKEPKLLTRDHNLLNYLIDKNVPKEEMKKYANNLIAITNSIDGYFNEKQSYGYNCVDLTNDSILFLASDGFYNFYNMNDIYAQFNEFVDLAVINQTLLDEAIANGSNDNISFSYLKKI